MSFSTGGIGTDGPWVQSAGTGSTTDFPLAHKVYSEDDIVVLLTVDATDVTTIQTKTTHYTVTGVADDAHDATVPTVHMVTDPASGETLTRYRKGRLIQDLVLGSTQFWQSLPAEKKLDLIVMDMQWMNLELQRTARGSLASGAVTTTLEEVYAAAGYTTINALTGKASVVDADLLRLGDSADSFSEKKILASVLQTYMFLAATLGGDMDANGKDIHSLALATFAVKAIGNSGATKTVDWNEGAYQTITLTANCAITFTAPTTYPARLQLDITQDGTGSRTITWSSSPLWAGGSAPTLTTTLTTGNDIITFIYDGTSYKGVPALDFS